MNKDVTELFCLVDAFCKAIEENLANKLLSGDKRPTRIPEIILSEIIAIILIYQQSPCENFKAFYLRNLAFFYKLDFPKLPL